MMTVINLSGSKASKDAVAFLNTQLFTTPKWLLNQDILAKINPKRSNQIDAGCYFK
jgi:hypothetical protein